MLEALGRHLPHSPLRCCAGHTEHFPVRSLLAAQLARLKALQEHAVGSLKAACMHFDTAAALLVDGLQRLEDDGLQQLLQDLLCTVRLDQADTCHMLVSAVPSSVTVCIAPSSINKCALPSSVTAVRSDAAWTHCQVVPASAKLDHAAKF